MPKENVSVDSSFRQFLKRRSVDYEQYGRYLGKDLTMQDMPYRFISYLGDLALMLMPILFWDLCLITTSAGWISFKIFNVIISLTDILLMASIIASNSILIVLFKGQTFGKIAMDFKVVGKQNQQLSSKQLLIREVAGFGVPLAIGYLFFGIIGILGLSIINGIVVLVDPQHRSIVDFFIQCKVVRLSEKGYRSNFMMKEKEKEEKKITPAENKYDLHVYSSFSHDGEMEVEDLFKLAKEMGVEVLSICDHNCAKANLVAAKVAPLYNITYISGINIDCMYKGEHVRILGYGINPNDERLAQIEYENLAKESVVSARRIELFEEFTGFKIDLTKMGSHRFQVVPVEMIAKQILSNSEYRKTKLLAPYLSGNKKEAPIHHFVNDFFGKGAPAYVPIAHPDARDMIALIHSCGGSAMLAHPMRSLRNNTEVLIDLLQEDIDGVELFTPYHSKEDTRYLIPLVKKYHLASSAGSEFHGKNRPQFVLGKTYCPKDVEEVIFRFVEKHKTL